MLIFPDWPAPPQVRTATTTRLGGVSLGPFASFNLGAHVGDDPKHVAANRERLAQLLNLPAEPTWLKQVHGCKAIAAERKPARIEADAAFTRQTGVVCAVLTADCLPILLCDRTASCVAAIHAGWRGLAAGVIATAVTRLACDPGELLAWLGPAIGPQAFEVGEEVRAAFLKLDAANNACFKPSVGGRWLADIYGLARQQLRSLGIRAIYGTAWRTFSDRQRFFSYRRDGVTGRMASLIWLNAD